MGGLETKTGSSLRSPSINRRMGGLETQVERYPAW